MRTLSPVCLSLAALLLVAACGSPRGVDRPLSTATVAAHMNRLISAEGLPDRESTARKVAYAVDRLREAGLQPALTESFLVHVEGDDVGSLRQRFLRRASGDVGHVVGYVTGRDATVVDRLVLLTADLNSPGGAAVLEAARLLAAEARWGPHPRASIGVALWSPPRTGATGASDFLQRPTWSLDAIERVLVVTHDTTGVATTRARWAEAGIPMEVISTDSPRRIDGSGPLPVGAAFQLAEASILAARRAADVPTRRAVSSR